MREDEKREGIPLRENEQQWRGRELQVREPFLHSHGESGKIPA